MDDATFAALDRACQRKAWRCIAGSTACLLLMLAAGVLGALSFPCLAAGLLGICSFGLAAVLYSAAPGMILYRRR